MSAAECPSYTVKGIAAHILGDDLSLLSRQRDGAPSGLALLARKGAGPDFRSMLNTFNDQWVAATDFLSTPLLIELLGLAGEWTAEYYRRVDPQSLGEAVGLFGAAQGSTSPFWQAIAREYLERWIHHSQIRRALSLSSVDDRWLLVPGIEVVSAIMQMEPGVPPGPDDAWGVGPLVLGPVGQAADILTRRHTAEEVRALVPGPAETVDQLAAVVARS